MEDIYRNVRFEGVCTKVEEREDGTRLYLRRKKGVYVPHVHAFVPQMFKGRNVLITETLERDGDLFKKVQKVKADGVEPLIATYEFRYCLLG